MILERIVLKNGKGTEAPSRDWDRESYTFCLKSPSTFVEAADLYNPTGKGAHL